MQSEVNFLGRLSHPNLVKLLGYCWEDRDLLLVYEFMQKGSLENHLFGSKIWIQFYLISLLPNVENPFALNFSVLCESYMLDSLTMLFLAQGVRRFSHLHGKSGLKLLSVQLEA